LRGWKEKLVARINELETTLPEVRMNLHGTKEPVNPGISSPVGPKR
jgi:hypothetical protein